MRKVSEAELPIFRAGWPLPGVRVRMEVSLTTRRRLCCLLELALEDLEMRGFVSMLLSSFEDERMGIPVVSIRKSSSDLNSIAADAAAFFIIGEDEEEDGVVGLY